MSDQKYKVLDLLGKAKRELIDACNAANGDAKLKKSIEAIAGRVEQLQHQVNQ